ncbi:AraC family transcriptional regulator [Salinicola endophyticus]|uniref:AraC family transcriptional regulator n=1 Tax=Salinicola endophyticus TaxID=1949083 RepID=A0ABY8FE42_9GAMM|nr:AraC family transcriptional regulator [Salinicola endophyticus]WFF41090.1 AraC family transcriptional regulator [Salinicola endophyticus]
MLRQSLPPLSAQTSPWPLPLSGRRVVIPQTAIAALETHPLCRECLPHGVGLYPHAAGHHMQRSAPRDHLLIYCEAGSGMVECAGKLSPVRAGDVLLLRPQRGHRYRANPRDPWTIYWVHLGGTAAADYFDAIAEPQDEVCIKIGRHPRIVAEWELLLSVVTRFRTLPLIHAANQLKALLTYIALVRHQRDARHAALDVSRVNAWLQAHLDRRVELATLVDATSELSRCQFIREYKRQTGQTPMQAFQHFKISRACYLLDVTTLSVGQIAADLGYDDPYYFSRQFKKVMGVAPRDYRREHATS